MPAQSGYVLTDLSTNGVFVNGDRVKYSALLGRGDVIRVGSEELRFHADVAATAAQSRSVRPVTREEAPAARAGSRGVWVAVLVVALIAAAAFLVVE